MSEKMYPIPFASLMNWVVTEYAQSGDIFGVHKKYEATGKSLPIFGERIETPFGPAAGPNSQLAQNIIAAYFGGRALLRGQDRTEDGRRRARRLRAPSLHPRRRRGLQSGVVHRADRGAGAGRVHQGVVRAQGHQQRIYGLGDPDGFVFNMSVGYDLEGIKGRKGQQLHRQHDGREQDRRSSRSAKRSLTELFRRRDAIIIAHISPRVSRSVTVSTLHGCPPQEIERIASYLLTEKHLHTFVKCNPTILGYKTARKTLDCHGLRLHRVRRAPLQRGSPVAATRCPCSSVCRRSRTRQGWSSVSSSPTPSPSDTTRGELPNDEMYMSGRSLFPLTIEMCSRISREFGGKMRISFAGGAEYFNCDKLFAAGIWPITVATTILKPGGYNRPASRWSRRSSRWRTAPSPAPTPPPSPTSPRIRPHGLPSPQAHQAPAQPQVRPSRCPGIDCFIAPCKGGCPIEQDIPEYLELCRKGLYGPALKLITEKNALPFITGTICAHRCQDKCYPQFL